MSYNQNEIRTKLEQMKSEQVPVYSDKVEIPGYKLVRTIEEKRPIRILSNKYHVEQHVDAFDRVVGKLEKSHLNYEIKNFQTNENNGRNSVQVSFGFPEISWNVDGSETMATFEMVNSNDGLIKYSELFGAFRIVCANGLIIGETLYKQNKKHSKNFLDRLDDFDEFYDTLTSIKKLSKVFERSQEVKITKNFIDILVKAGFSSRVINNLPEAFNRYVDMYNETLKNYNTLHSVWSILTNYLTHVISKTDIKRSISLNATLTKLMLNELS